MSSLINTSSRSTFALNVCDSTPPCTKYDITGEFGKVKNTGSKEHQWEKSDFDKIKKSRLLKKSSNSNKSPPDKNSFLSLDKWGLPPSSNLGDMDLSSPLTIHDRGRGFGVASRDDYGSYLDLKNVSHLDPTSTSYVTRVDGMFEDVGGRMGGEKIEGPKVEDGVVGGGGKIRLYKPRSKAVISNMSKQGRWSKPASRKFGGPYPKDPLGPGKYKPETADVVLSTEKKVKGFNLNGPERSSGPRKQIDSNFVRDRINEFRTLRLSSSTSSPPSKTFKSTMYRDEDISGISRKPPVPGPGAYDPMVNARGVREISMNRNKADVAIEGMIKEEGVDLRGWRKRAKEVGNTDIMKGSKGYNCRGFGTSPRWDTRFKRVGVSDEYMRKIREAEEEVRKLDEEENKKTAKQKSTFGHSAQFTLFNSTSNTPGPGSYKPDKPPVRMSGNIKLGHKTAIPGGRGVDGEAVGDDDSFTTPGGFRINVGETCEAKDKSLGWRKCRVIRVTDEGKYDVEFKDGEVMQDVIKGLLREPLGRVLIGKSLVHNTGDKSIDSKMQEYRKAVDKRVLRGQLEEEVGIEDDLSVVSGLTMMNRTMFMSDETPRFVDYVGHMTVTPSLRAELNRRDEFAATLRKKKKKAPKNYDMSKTLDFIMGIKGLGEEEAELVREAREEATA